jgi:hypothetical protein
MFVGTFITKSSLFSNFKLLQFEENVLIWLKDLFGIKLGAKVIIIFNNSVDDDLKRTIKQKLVEKGFNRQQLETHLYFLHDPDDIVRKLYEFMQANEIDVRQSLFVGSNDNELEYGRDAGFSSNRGVELISDVLFFM